MLAAVYSSCFRRQPTYLGPQKNKHLFRHHPKFPPGNNANRVEWKNINMQMQDLFDYCHHY